MRRLRNYLRMHRRRSHLTQEELAFLLGYADQSMITRLEREERAVTFAVVHACLLLFGVEPRELFPGLFENVEDRVLARLHALRDRLREASASAKSAAKRELLEQAIQRMGAPHAREI
jgi:transcriptional regulator with XRE-family HTH domain